MTVVFWKLVLWIKGSADNQPGGASSKKLTAFWVLVFLVTPIVITWLVWAFIHDKWDNLIPIVDSLLLFIGVCLGINAWEKKQGVAQIKPDEQTG